MIATVFDDRACKLGEGPLWNPKRQQFFWFDILGKTLMTRTSEGQKTWTFDRHVSAAGWVGEDALLIASETDLFRFDLTTGKEETIVSLEADNPLTRSNDGRADPWGGFWIGTMGFNGEPGAGAIYRYYKGELRQLYPNITVSNGICFAPEGNIGYFADTRQGKVWRQQLNAVDGWPVGDPEVFLDHGEGGPNADGAVVDTDGNYWSAEWGHSRVRAYSPAGEVLRDVTIPAGQATCPAFGGAGLRDLYVTSANVGLGSEAMTETPLAGQTFVIEDVAQGQMEPEVIL